MDALQLEGKSIAGTAVDVMRHLHVQPSRWGDAVFFTAVIGTRTFAVPVSREKIPSLIAYLALYLEGTGGGR